jgi:secreted Zn-dependent insulinase-like peptidase
MGYGRLDETEVLARLWRQLLDVHLRELMYLADEASIHPYIELAPNGITLSISGFSDSLSVLAEEYLKKVISFNV